jgi:hypothetical protein
MNGQSQHATAYPAITASATTTSETIITSVI